MQKKWGSPKLKCFCYCQNFVDGRRGAGQNQQIINVTEVSDNSRVTEGKVTLYRLV